MRSVDVERLHVIPLDQLGFAKSVGIIVAPPSNMQALSCNRSDQVVLAIHRNHQAVQSAEEMLGVGVGPVDVHGSDTNGGTP